MGSKVKGKKLCSAARLPKLCCLTLGFLSKLRRVLLRHFLRGPR